MDFHIKHGFLLEKGDKISWIRNTKTNTRSVHQYRSHFKQRNSRLTKLDVGNLLIPKHCWKIGAFCFSSMKYKESSTKWDIYIEQKWRNSNKNDLSVNYKQSVFQQRACKEVLFGHLLNTLTIYSFCCSWTAHQSIRVAEKQRVSSELENTRQNQIRIWQTQTSNENHGCEKYNDYTCSNVRLTPIVMVTRYVYLQRYLNYWKMEAKMKLFSLMPDEN